MYVDTVADDNALRSQLAERVEVVGGRAGRRAPPTTWGGCWARRIARGDHLTRDGVRDGLERVKRLPATSGHAGTTMGFGIVGPRRPQGRVPGPAGMARRPHGGILGRMTTAEARPLTAAPPLPELSPQAEVALLCRMLFREGYDDHLAGHITYRQPDGTLLVNPFALTWDEVKASDIMRIDMDGNVLDGPWSVTPAITLHVELHRARHDVGVAVHNHPRWGTIWADLCRVPPVYDQTGAMVADDPAIDSEYGGPVDGTDNAKACVDARATPAPRCSPTTVCSWSARTSPRPTIGPSPSSGVADRRGTSRPSGAGNR